MIFMGVILKNPHHQRKKKIKRMLEIRVKYLNSIIIALEQEFEEGYQKLLQLVRVQGARTLDLKTFE